MIWVHFQWVCKQFGRNPLCLVNAALRLYYLYNSIFEWCLVSFFFIQMSVRFGGDAGHAGQDHAAVGTRGQQELERTFELRIQ